MSASPWDRLEFSDKNGPVPLDLRTRFRVEAVEAALESKEPNALLKIGSEIGQRRTYWRERLNRMPAGNAALRNWMLASMPLHRNWNGKLVLLMLALIIAGALIRDTAIEVVIGFAFIVSLIALFVWNVRRSRKSSAVVHSLETATCPACEWNLSACDVVPAESTSGERLGPRTCPGCGTPWPLIPPPCPQ